MEGDSAIQAMYSVELEKYKANGAPLPPELQQSIERTRADYERWLDARYAAARGHVDAVIDPRDSRQIAAAIEERMVADSLDDRQPVRACGGGHVLRAEARPIIPRWDSRVGRRDQGRGQQSDCGLPHGFAAARGDAFFASVKI